AAIEVQDGKAVLGVEEVVLRAGKRESRVAAQYERPLVLSEREGTEERGFDEPAGVEDAAERVVATRRGRRLAERKRVVARPRHGEILGGRVAHDVERVIAGEGWRCHVHRQRERKAAL